MRDILNKMVSKVRGVSDSIADAGYRALIDEVDRLVILLSQKNPKKLTELIAASGVSPNPSVSAKTACKIICFYIECKVKGVYNDTFSAFLSRVYNLSGLSPLSMRMLETQEDLIEALTGSAFVVVEIKSYTQCIEYFTINRKVGTVRIRTGEDSFHSMMIYHDLDKKIPVISDPSYRGRRVPFTKYVNEGNFEYVTIIEENR